MVRVTAEDVSTIIMALDRTNLNPDLLKRMMRLKQRLKSKQIVADCVMKR